MIGKLIDQRYKIVAPIGEGAFGHTYQAEDTKRPQNPICVVKHLQPRQTNPEYLLKAQELFEREAKTLERLGKHPQIPSLLAHLKIDGDFYLVEEYIPGQTLDQEFAHSPKKSETEVMQIISELLEILAFVHNQKIVHRDIKPSNIIRNQNDRKLVLIDFGAVMEHDGETFLGSIIGTPGYIAPEQSQGKTSFYSDIYAVGVVALQALIRINPNFLAKNERGEIILPEKTEISSEFSAILNKMIAADRSDRYLTATAVLTDLNRLQTQDNLEDSKQKTKGIANPIQLKFIASSLLLLILGGLSWLGINQYRTAQISQPNLLLKGKAIDGELNQDNLCSDLIFEQDIYCQKYFFIGKKDQVITVEMNSSSFDPLLIIQQPNGDKLDSNSDRSVSNWNAQIKVKLPVDGEYTVIARTTSPGESGVYTVRARINN